MRNKKNKTVVDDFSSCDFSDGEISPQVSDNSIYFYCEVKTDTILDFNRKLRELDKRNYLDSISRQSIFYDNIIIEPIVIYIQSPGGDVNAGFSAMDTILQCKSPIYTVIDGAAASAATLMSVVGTKRFITPHSFALIHQLSGNIMGNYDDLKDDILNCDLLMEKMKEVYIKYTKISGQTLEEILKKDIYFNAERCLELGIVDQIK